MGNSGRFYLYHLQDIRITRFRVGLLSQITVLVGITSSTVLTGATSAATVTKIVATHGTDGS